MNEQDSQDRLSGWKEIATHLRRSVRSVQRWERELGLPVQRVKTGTGQSVFASKAAVDAWFSRNGLSLPDEKAEPQPEADSELTIELAPVPIHVTPPPESAPRRLPVLLLIGLALAVAAFAWWPARPNFSAPLKLTFQARTIEARTTDGRLMWTHDFARDVATLPDDLITPVSRTTRSVAEADLDGDGLLERLVPVTFGVRGNPAPSSDALFAFTSDGRVLWSIQPEQAVTCGGKTFTAPWRIKSVLVSSDPQDKRVWVSFLHHTWWPSLVMEIQPDGTQTLRYLQAGWVMALQEWKTAAGTRVAAGGVLNEEARASVTVFDPTRPLTMWTGGSDPTFQCDVSADAPERVVLFPDSEVSRARQSAYLMVHQLQPIGGGLRVEVDTARLLASIDAAGVVTEVSYSDHYRAEHEQLNAARLIDHRLGMCPEMNRPAEIREWTPGAGWRTYAVDRR